MLQLHYSIRLIFLVTRLFMFHDYKLLPRKEPTITLLHSIYFAVIPSCIPAPKLRCKLRNILRKKLSNYMKNGLIDHAFRRRRKWLPLEGFEMTAPFKDVLNCREQLSIPTEIWNLLNLMSDAYAIFHRVLVPFPPAHPNFWMRQVQTV